MKFLLAAVNAKYIHSNPAIYSLRAYAEKTLRSGSAEQKTEQCRTGWPEVEQNGEGGPVIELAEYTINQDRQEILADIWNRKPDVVGFSCYIWNWRIIRELIVELHKLLPHVPIWLGGPEVSYDGEELLQQYPQVTGIFVGEGEASFRDVVAYYWQREIQSLSNRKLSETSGNGAILGEHRAVQAADLEQIPGLYLPTGYTPMREPLDLDELPFLYHDLEPFTNRIIYYETSRGCPCRCSYCLSSIDKTVRFRSMEIVKQELQFFLDKQVAQVKFVDRTFNCHHEHAMGIWEYIREHDNGITNFHFEISADILREEEIQLLNSLRPGLVQLEIGVQTTNPQTLEAIRRKMDVQRLKQIVAALQKGKNIHIHLDLIAGLPYENYESFGHSFDEVHAMKPEQLQLGFLKVLKGSYMQEKAQEYGLVYWSQPPYEVMYTSWLSYGEVRRLKKIEEVVELYYNSNQYPHTLQMLERAFDTPFRMFEKMADYFEEKGYFLNSPARAYRYQVLLDFCEANDAEHLEIYRELLTFDMYLRENLKSRPNFARDHSGDKEYIREFYQQEAECRKYLPEYKGYDWKQLSKMTHLEGFTYPVWDVEELIELRGAEAQGQKEKPEVGYVLFDYRSRNPLTYEASIQVIS